MQYALSSVYKMYYSTEGKFSGTITENLTSLYEEFQIHCRAQGFAEIHEACAFSAWTMGDAYRFYVNHLDGKGISSEQLIAKLRERYYTPEREMMLIEQYNDIYFKENLSKNPY